LLTLHEDINAFRVLLENIHDRTGYRLDVLEKDYYVTLLLKQLADKQINGLKAEDIISVEVAIQKLIKLANLLEMPKEV